MINTKIILNIIFVTVIILMSCSQKEQNISYSSYSKTTSIKTVEKGRIIGESISILSWNIQDFGGTKSNEEIEKIAEIVRDYDIVAIQEVVAGTGGSQAVAKLAMN